MSSIGSEGGGGKRGGGGPNKKFWSKSSKTYREVCLQVDNSLNLIERVKFFRRKRHKKQN